MCMSFVDILYVQSSALFALRVVGVFLYTRLNYRKRKAHLKILQIKMDDTQTQTQTQSHLAPFFPVCPLSAIVTKRMVRTEDVSSTMPVFPVIRTTTPRCCQIKTGSKSTNPNDNTYLSSTSILSQLASLAQTSNDRKNAILNAIAKAYNIVKGEKSTYYKEDLNFFANMHKSIDADKTQVEAVIDDKFSMAAFFISLLETEFLGVSVREDVLSSESISVKLGNFVSTLSLNLAPNTGKTQSLDEMPLFIRNLKDKLSSHTERRLFSQDLLTCVTLPGRVFKKPGGVGPSLFPLGSHCLTDESMKLFNVIASAYSTMFYMLADSPRFSEDTRQRLLIYYLLCSNKATHYPGDSNKDKSHTNFCDAIQSVFYQRGPFRPACRLVKPLYANHLGDCVSCAQPTPSIPTPASNKCETVCHDMAEGPNYIVTVRVADTAASQSKFMKRTPFDKTAAFRVTKDGGSFTACHFCRLDLSTLRKDPRLKSIFDTNWAKALLDSNETRFIIDTTTKRYTPNKKNITFQKYDGTVENMEAHRLHARLATMLLNRTFVVGISKETSSGATTQGISTASHASLHAPIFDKLNESQTMQMQIARTGEQFERVLAWLKTVGLEEEIKGMQRDYVIGFGQTVSDEDMKMFLTMTQKHTLLETCHPYCFNTRSTLQHNNPHTPYSKEERHELVRRSLSFPISPFSSPFISCAIIKNQHEECVGADVLFSQGTQ